MCRPEMFQCSSASRKFLSWRECSLRRRWCRCFSALQRAENSSQLSRTVWRGQIEDVSVLFSEPKIPHALLAALAALQRACFSALQRAENSSYVDQISVYAALVDVSVLFSEPKIPQFVSLTCTCNDAERFSALQRAENSSRRSQREDAREDERFSALQRAENSSYYTLALAVCAPKFQCSSASRKFLTPGFGAPVSFISRFSALQRAENSSFAHGDQVGAFAQPVSVLFSEPKIPQRRMRHRRALCL